MRRAEGAGGEEKLNMDRQDGQDLELTLAKIAERRKEREGKNHRGGKAR